MKRPLPLERTAVLKWNSLDGSRVEWLRDHPTTDVRLELAGLDYLQSRFDLRVARPLGRTKFGRHVEEYREHREDRALHGRPFAAHLVIPTDWVEPGLELDGVLPAPGPGHAGAPHRAGGRPGAGVTHSSSPNSRIQYSTSPGGGPPGSGGSAGPGA